MASFDRKAYLVEEIGNMCKSYIEDLAHIPDVKITESPMGCARNALTFTAECAGFNSWIADALGGTIAPMPSQETRDRFYASMDSREKVTTALQNSCDRIIAALQSLDDADLDEPTTAPWGASMTKFKLATMAYVHMIYHNGQVNYIQTLYGDPDNHWAE